MMTAVSRRNALALCVLALAVALAALLVAAPQKAAAAHGDCELRAFAPGALYGIYASTSASVECATAKNVIHISIVVTRDGSFIESTDRTCHKRADCPTYMIVNDPPGDQTWCSTVSARVGPHAYPTVTRCETAEAP